MYRVASLFCGIGGSDLGMIGGFYYLGNHYVSLPFEIVYAVDFDKSVVEVYNHNFRNKAICADVCDEDFTKVPDVDVVIGGFPCQSFSTANTKRNFTDDRALLYKQIVRFLRVKQPKYFICENVKGLTTLQKGEVLKTILQEFSDCGYTIKYEVLNAVDYGIPQKRERIIIVGQRGNENGFVFPHPTIDVVPLRRVVDPFSDKNKRLIFSKRAIEGAKKHMNDSAFRRLNARNLDEPCTTITAHLGKVTCNSGDPIICLDKEKELYRRLSVREAARIQSFPETFNLHQIEGKALKQIGNAVPPMMMWYVARALSENF